MGGVGNYTRTWPHLLSRIPTLMTSLTFGAEPSFRIDQTLDTVWIGHVDDFDVCFSIARRTVDLEVPDPHDPLPERLGDPDIPNVGMKDFRGAPHDDASLIDGPSGGNPEAVPSVAKNKDPKQPSATDGQADEPDPPSPVGDRGRGEGQQHEDAAAECHTDGQQAGERMASNQRRTSNPQDAFTFRCGIRLGWGGTGSIDIAAIGAGHLGNPWLNWERSFALVADDIAGIGHGGGPG